MAPRAERLDGRERAREENASRNRALGALDASGQGRADDGVCHAPSPFRAVPDLRGVGRAPGVTNDLRIALKLWPFKPMDLAADEIEAQRKARTAEGGESERD